MKASELLRKAADSLWDGGTWTDGAHHSYICFEVSRLSKYGPTTDADQATAIAERISERLGDSASLVGWLRARGYVNEFAPVAAEIQAYRKAWCLHLADEFEAEGN